MSADGTLSSSLEDYLEAAYHCELEKRAARVKDIAARLNVNLASVTGALRSLAAKGLVNYAPYELVTLTTKGRRIARDVVRRHEVLRTFFVDVLGIDARLAEESACKMEHAIPPEIVERFTQYLQFVRTCPVVGTEWSRDFGYHCLQGTPGECKTCLTGHLNTLAEKGTLSDPSGKPVMGLATRRAKTATTLDRLKPGQSARVVAVKESAGAIFQRLNEMGMYEGAEVAVIRFAPLKDPMEVRLHGYELSLRRAEAACVEVELL